MCIAGRLAAAVLLVLGLASGGVAQSPLRSGSGAAPSPAAPARPAGTVVIGALLPLTGPSAWIGKEMRQGMELAIADLNALTPAKGPPGQGSAAGKGPAAEKPGGSPKSPATGRSPEQAGADDRADAAEKAGDARKGAVTGRRAAPESTPSATGTTREPAAAEQPASAGPPAIADMVSVPAVPLALETRDVATRDTHEALAGLTSLLAAAVPVILTASPTPTLAIHSEASARDVLVVHQGPVTSRLPVSSRTIVHVRSPAAARAEALVLYARARSATRLAVLAGGDEFGKAVRAAAAGRWRAWGLTVVQDESILPGSPEARERLRRLARLAPDALLLGLEGPDLGDVVRQAREAGYPGFILALDDDPAVALAAGPALEPIVVLAEAFVAESGTRAARFAEAYQKKFATSPTRWAAQAYETVAMLAEGLRAARDAGGQPIRGTPLRDALVARGSFAALAGERLALREDGAVERPLALFTAAGERLTFVRYLDPARSGAATAPR
jgi:ABC-type branched-subunit amino acid transport system substrate-binding protein